MSRTHVPSLRFNNMVRMVMAKGRDAHLSLYLYGMLAGLSLGTIIAATGMAAGQEASAHPPAAVILKASPPRPAAFSQIRCKDGDTSCDDLLGYSSMHMYARIRSCWHPPDGTMVTSAFRFGDAAKEAKPLDPAKTVVSVSFELKPDGTLLNAPRSNTLNAPHALVEDVIRAIEHCQPYDMLPSSKYEKWKDVLVRFGIEPRPRTMSVDRLLSTKPDPDLPCFSHPSPNCPL